MRAAIATLLGTAACLAAASPAHALLCGTFLNPLSVSATAMAFGDYVVTDPDPVTTMGAITLTCAIPLDVVPTFTVAISTGASGTYSPRRMTLGARRLNYNLYTTETYTAVWGDGSGGTVTQVHSAGVLTGPIVFTVYGLAPAGQWSGAGLYQDTLVVTVTY